MNKYLVVEAATAVEIGDEVTKRLNSPGWFLVGGLSVTCLKSAQFDKTFDEYRYAQAMVFDERQLQKVIEAGAKRNRHHPSRPAAPEPQEVTEG